MLSMHDQGPVFLEDEVPFVPVPGDPEPGPMGPGPGDGRPSDGGLSAWFQRWRVPVTALFIVLIGAATFLAFGAKPEGPTARSTDATVGSSLTAEPGIAPDAEATPGSSAATAEATTGSGLPGPASTDGVGPVVPPDAAATPPTAGAPARVGVTVGSTVATTAATTTIGAPTTAKPAAPVATGPAGPATTRPGATTAATGARPGPSAPAPAPSAPATTRSGPSAPPTTRPSASTTATPTTTRPPDAAVPGYATGVTQARGPNDPPFIANPGLVASTVGQPVRYQIGVSARPGENLTFSATGLPAGLKIDSRTGLVSGTPNRAETSGVQVTVSSSLGKTFTQGFTWTVTR